MGPPRSLREPPAAAAGLLPPPGRSRCPGSLRRVPLSSRILPAAAAASSTTPARKSRGTTSPGAPRTITSTLCGPSTTSTTLCGLTGTNLLTSPSSMVPPAKSGPLCHITGAAGSQAGSSTGADSLKGCTSTSMSTSAAAPPPGDIGQAGRHAAGPGRMVKAIRGPSPGGAGMPGRLEGRTRKGTSSKAATMMSQRCRPTEVCVAVTTPAGPPSPVALNTKDASRAVAGREGLRMRPSLAQHRMSSGRSVAPIMSDGATGPVDSVATRAWSAACGSWRPLYTDCGGTGGVGFRD
mmetsp:Transcript_39765/g.127114  ORF Transcript_39765/g.127114 Transcript_39765/m.127114 type:complete len:294 (-) Transcript_39765:1756-2637(-)